MTAVVAAEVRKITTTRMWIVLLAITAATGILGSGAVGALGLIGGTNDAFQSPDFLASMYTGGNGFARILAIVGGAIAMGNEYRHRTLADSYLAVPRRWQLVTGKAIATAFYGLAFGLVATVIGLLVAIPFVLGKDGSLFLSKGSSWQALTMNLVSLAVWAMIGMALGILIRNMIASVLVAIGFSYMLEPLLNLLFQAKNWSVATNLMPSGATDGMIGVSLAGMGQSGAGEGVDAWPAAAELLVLFGWAVIPAVVGLFITVRRDVN